MTVILPPIIRQPELHPEDFNLGETGMNEKWFAKSLTIWGAFITGLTAGLPAINVMLNTFVGWSIEPDWVASLDAGVKALVGGMGSLVGLYMVIRGRFDATKKLTVMP